MKFDTGGDRLYTGAMKTRSLSVLLACALLDTTALPAGAHEPSAYDDYSADAMALDALIARPLCLAATIVGTGLFIVSLPITAISRSTGKAAETLVGKPAQATFTRKLGNLSGLD